MFRKCSEYSVWWLSREWFRNTLLTLTETGVCLVSCGGGIRFQCTNVRVSWTRSRACGWPLETPKMLGKRLRPCWACWSLMCCRCAKMTMCWIPGSLQPSCHSLHLAGLKRCENQNVIITHFNNVAVIICFFLCFFTLVKQECCIWRFQLSGM